MSTWIPTLTALGQQAANLDAAIAQFRVAWESQHTEGEPYDFYGQPLFGLLSEEREKLRKELLRINELLRKGQS